jgi:hypothetical protein
VASTWKELDQQQKPTHHQRMYKCTVKIISTGSTKKHEDFQGKSTCVDVGDGSSNDNTSTATLKSIIDVYGKRSERETWAKDDEFTDFQLKEAG